MMILLSCIHIQGQAESLVLHSEVTPKPLKLPIRKEGRLFNDEKCKAEPQRRIQILLPRWSSILQFYYLLFSFRIMYTEAKSF